MATVQDVAAYILREQGSMSAMKLQKLVYYSQAWSLVWDDDSLFEEDIQAWANGPVVYALYEHHRGEFMVAQWPWGDPEALTEVQQETIDAVLATYGHLSARQLSHLTHSESPWRDARAGLPDTARSSALITPAALVDYYAVADAAADATPVEDLDWSGWDPGSDGEK